MKLCEPATVFTEGAFCQKFRAPGTENPRVFEARTVTIDWQKMCKVTWSPFHDEVPRDWNFITFWPKRTASRSLGLLGSRKPGPARQGGDVLAQGQIWDMLLVVDGGITPRQPHVLAFTRSLRGQLMNEHTPVGRRSRNPRSLNPQHHPNVKHRCAGCLSPSTIRRL